MRLRVIGLVGVAVVAAILAIRFVPAGCLPAFLLACPAKPAAPPIVVVERFEDGVDHFLGPQGIIRTRNVPPDNWIEMSVVVGPDGKVISAEPLKREHAVYTFAGGRPIAKPLTGAEAFRAEAVALARQWRFVPFQRDGKPVAARVDWLTVRIYGPEQRPAVRVPFPPVRDWNSLAMTLRRSSCMGECPAYTVTVHGDGLVEYVGQSSVAITGRHTARVPGETVRRLFDRFRNADFLWLNDGYDRHVMDAPAYWVGISFDGRSKMVFDNDGLEAGMPTAVAHLEDDVDHILDTARWTRGNAATVPSLKSEGWAFAAKTCDASSVLSGVAHLGTREAVRDLIRAGAPIASQCDGVGLLGVYHADGIYYAAERGDFAMTMAFVDAGADKNPAEMENAFALAAAAGNAALVDALAARIAGGPDHATLQSALELGAGSCRRDVVTWLLRRGAVAKSDEGRAAVMNAAHATGQGDERCAETITLLAKAGAPLDGRRASPGEIVPVPSTPLRAALFRPAVVRALIAAGVDVNARDGDGKTTLMECVDPEVTRALLAAGADPTLRDNKGRTALETLRDHTDQERSRAVIRQWMATHRNRE